MEDFSRLFELFPYQMARFPQKAALAEKTPAGAWKPYSTSACIQYIDQVSAGLLQFKDVHKGDKIVLLASEGSVAWNFLDLGIQQIGRIPVPVHPVFTRKQLVSIFRETEARICFVQDAQAYRKVVAIKAELPYPEFVYTIKKEKNLPYWSEILQEPLPNHRELIQIFRGTIHEDDLSTIQYTSGDYGAPRGVLLSHKNIVSNIKASLQVIPVTCDKRTISFLPLSQSFERMVTYTYIAAGASVYYSDFTNQPELELQAVKPHYFTAVPKMLDYFFQMLVRRASTLSPIRKKTNLWAIRLAWRYKERNSFKPFYQLQLQLADLLVYRHWRKLMGNKIDGIVAGAASLPPRLGRFFSAAGISVREGYGLTEASPAVSLNRFENRKYRFGTVGIPLPGIAVKIDAPSEAGEGEVLVKGPNVMIGYFNLPDLTDQSFTPDGWLRTGDIGSMEEGMFLKISGRKRDALQKADGTIIPVQQIEDRLSESPFVDHCMVLGTNRPFLVAIISPEAYFLKEWLTEQQVFEDSAVAQLKNRKVNKLFSDILKAWNDHARPAEKIVDFFLAPEKWTLSNGLIASSHKPNREAVFQKYKVQIERMYQKKKSVS